MMYQNIFGMEMFYRDQRSLMARIFFRSHNSKGRCSLKFYRFDRDLMLVKSNFQSYHVTVVSGCLESRTQWAVISYRINWLRSGSQRNVQLSNQYERGLPSWQILRFEIFVTLSVGRTSFIRDVSCQLRANEAKVTDRRDRLATRISSRVRPRYATRTLHSPQQTCSSTYIYTVLAFVMQLRGHTRLFSCLGTPLSRIVLNQTIMSFL